MSLKIKKIIVKILALAAIVAFVMQGNGVIAEEASVITVSAKSAVLITADTLDVIYEKSANEKLSMASTTKIMTAYLALEYAEKNGDDIVTVTKEMVMVEGSSMGLREGDKLHLTDIVTGMMLSSGNDAANTVALHISGNAADFAVLMNEKAKEIGMENTNFVTPSGLDDEAHYSTAYDMAILAAAALKNEKFKEIVSTSKCTIDFVNPEKRAWYSNHNSLLGKYEGCIGVKTGYTKKSGRCLVSAAERNGITLIAVTLNDPDDWNDHIKLLDYGFSAAKIISTNESGLTGDIAVVGGESDRIKIKGTDGGNISVFYKEDNNLHKIIRLPKFVYAPVNTGDILGYVDYYNKDKKIISIPIVAAEDIEFKNKTGIFEKIFNKRE